MRQENSRDRRPAIQSIFAPESVALIGATDTPGSAGRALAENLSEFKGRVHFINPKKAGIFDSASYAAIGEARSSAFRAGSSPRIRRW